MGKAVVLFNDFNGVAQLWTITEVQHSEGGFLITAFDEEQQAMILEADLARIQQMTRRGISREFNAPQGGTTKLTLTIR